MELQTQRREYTYYDDVPVQLEMMLDYRKVSARIIFIKDLNSSEWKLQRVESGGDTYTPEDWQWLAKIAAKVDELYKELNFR